MDRIIYRPIGYIRTPFSKSDRVPIQATAGMDVEGEVELLHRYGEGLSDLEGFSHIILIYHLHCSDGYSLKLVPHVDREERGLFATRAPRRPNPLGFSVVRLLSVGKGKLRIKGVDMLDKTPLLDIKPYLPHLDCRRGARIGWLESGDRSSKDATERGLSR